MENNLRKRQYLTNSGFELKRIYTEADLKERGFEPERDLGDAGAYPNTRGFSKDMFRDDFWIIGQYSGFGDAEEANERFKYLIEQGQTGFSIALDLPTQVGLNSDNKMAKGEVGKVGVGLDSLEDVERLLDGIPFEKVRQIRTTANAIGPVMAAWYIAFCEKQGIDPNTIKFFLQNDPLKEYIGRGAYIFPPEAAVKLSADVLEYTSNYIKNWEPIAISGYHIRDSGATATQELAFTIANGIAYIEETLRRGVDIDVFGSKFSAFMATQMDFLEEVAKLRGMRKVWADVMKNRFGAKDPASTQLPYLIYTQGGTLQAQQPMNNIIRVTVMAMAAILGGGRTLATSSYDEALSLPTKEAAMIALRTQQILAYESNITKTVDPLGGSYAIESLTMDICNQVMDIIAKTDELGGAIKCIEKGFFQKELAKEAYEFQKSIENKERYIVGVNSFQVDEEIDIPIFTPNPESEMRQVERLRKLKANRDNNKLQAALKDVKQAAIENRNIIPETVEAVKSYATLEEVVDTLKEVYGEYTDSGIF